MQIIRERQHKDSAEPTACRSVSDLGLCPTKTKRTLLVSVLLFWRYRPDLNRRITVLQTGALPLGYCTTLLVTSVL